LLSRRKEKKRGGRGRTSKQEAKKGPTLLSALAAHEGGGDKRAKIRGNNTFNWGPGPKKKNR